MAYNIYTLGVPRAWPHRLLHIPSMTSREWKPGNKYGDDAEPTYAILSYTWGRFEVAEGPRLDIFGIDWKAPSISPDHFTVTDLTRLLGHIRLKHDYVWIDIACIDQKREKVKMMEVGRQGIIFKRAHKAYIWLNKHEPATIQQHMQTLMYCGYEFAVGNMDPQEAAGRMGSELAFILQDPWFSSLWTLQESFLQRHAILLNKRGQPITTDGPWIGESPHCQLMDVSGACAIARMAMDQAMEAEQDVGSNSSISPLLRQLRSLRITIDESGIDFMLCPNPNIQYAAARFRQTKYPEDRIYAIMQAYGYRLGNSSALIRKLERFRLEDLELQFLRAVNSQSSVLGQAFQHLVVPPRGQSWCITNHVRVPGRFHMIIVNEQFLGSTCTIEVRSKSEAYFEGDAVTLRQLSDFMQLRRQAALALVKDRRGAPSDLRGRNAYFSNGSRNNIFKGIKQGIFFDYTDDLDCAALSHEWPPDTTVLDDRTEAIIENRLTELDAAAKNQANILEATLNRYDDTKTIVLYLGRTKHVESMEVVLILVQGSSTRKGLNMRKKVSWRRIGICFWCIEGNYGHELTNVLKRVKGKLE